jgi:hypothetical protein
MKIITNQGLINRNQKIGQVTTIASLVILAGGLYMSFQKDQALLSFSFLALLVGFILSQIGIYFGNRWGRKPRPDEQVNMGLKGLDDKYTLYHYMTPVSHLLVGPAGVWIVLPYPQGGTITYQKGRWKQKGGNWYLKLFAQEGLSRPDLDVASGIDNMQRYFKKRLPDIEIPPTQAALVFTNSKSTIEVTDAPNPTLQVEKFKEFIRKEAKKNPFPPSKITQLCEVLPQD